MGGRVLGVEVGATALTGVVVTKRGPHDLVGAAMFPAPSPAAGLASLAEELDARGLPVHLVLHGAGHLHRIHTIPPMSPDDRQAYLARELRREHPEGPDRALAHAVVGRGQEADAPRDEVLAVGMPRPDLDRLLAGAEGARARIAVITTAPLALLRAAHALVPAEASEPVAVALWSAAGLTIAVGTGEMLVLARELPHIDTGPDPLERLASEIQRSLLSFRQQSRGRSVVRVLVASVLPELPGRLDALAERLSVPVLDLNSPFGALLPPAAEEGEPATPAEFLLAYGAALTPPGHSLNLLPEPIVLRRRARVLATTAAILVTLVAIIIGAAYVARAGEARALERSLLELGAERQRLVAEQAAITEAWQERQLYRNRLRVLKGLPPGLPVVPAALTEVGRLAPGTLRLERVTLTTDGGLARLGVAGLAEAGDLAEAQATVTAFYVTLRASPLFDDVSLLPAKGETAGASGPASPGGPKRLSFELSLLVRVLE